MDLMSECYIFYLECLRRQGLGSSYVDETQWNSLIFHMQQITSQRCLFFVALGVNQTQDLTHLIRVVALGSISSSRSSFFFFLFMHMCMFKFTGMGVWKCRPKVDVRWSLFYFTQWGRDSQSNPELTDIPGFISKLVPRNSVFDFEVSKFIQYF